MTAPSLKITPGRPPSPAQLRRLHQAAHWQAAPESLALALAPSPRVQWLYAQLCDRPVGVARIELIGDRVAYVSEFMITGRYQHRGYGTRLLRALIDLAHQAHARVMCLEATPESTAFYLHNGFLHAPTRMASLYFPLGATEAPDAGTTSMPALNA